MTTSLEQCPQSFADEGVRATLAKPARRGAPRSECMSSNLISAAALIVPRMSAAKNWRELVHFRAGLSSSAASRLGDGSGAPEMRSRLLWLRRPVGATPVPQARNVKARHGNAG